MAIHLTAKSICPSCEVAILAAHCTAKRCDLLKCPNPMCRWVGTATRSREMHLPFLPPPSPK